MEKKTKKTAKKPAKVVEEKAPKNESAFDGKYFYAVGKRKESVAQVRIYPAKKDGKTMVNSRELAEFFKLERQRILVESPLVAVGQAGNFNVSAKVSGGGMTGQSEAIRLGVSRALLKFDETLRKALKDLGYLTRDSRAVERKKAGLKKARRSPQWAKR